MRNSSAQAWKGFIYYSFSELSHVFATLTYAYIAMYYDMFEGEGIGKGPKVLVIAERYRDVGAQFIAPTSGESAFQGKGQKVLVGSRRTSTRPQHPPSTAPCPYALGGFDSLWW